MVRRAVLFCPHCEDEFDFDFDCDEFSEYGSTECPHCGYELDGLDPDDYIFAGHTFESGEDIPHVTLDRYKCSVCDEIFGLRPEFNGEVNCPYCGAKYD